MWRFLQIYGGGFSYDFTNITPVIINIRHNTRKHTNINFAISADAPATPVKPNKPATIDTRKKNSAHFNIMISSILQLCERSIALSELGERQKNLVVLGSGTYPDQDV